MSNGRDTLERVAPDAARAIRVIEATAWDQAGAAGLLDWTDPQAPVDGLMDAHYRSAVASTIYGGSSEVLRSLIVENRLGFPRSRPRR